MMKTGSSPAARIGGAFVMALILACALAAPMRAAGELPGATDLAAQGREMTRDGRPLVVMYSQDNCGWCDRARTQLVPMSAQPDIGARFVQIDIDRATPLIDFVGQTTTHGRFAQDEGIRFTPMLVLYGPSGQRLTEPVVGMGAVDFYADQVLRAIAQARAALALGTQQITSRNTPP
jgi:thioredoxin-related protein